MRRSGDASPEEIARIVNFAEPRPHGILGPKMIPGNGPGIISVRSFLPRATRAWLRLQDGRRVDMVRLSDVGFFEGKLEPGESYLIGFQDSTGYVEERKDPYSFPPVVSDLDVYLLAEGKNRRAYQKMGAHLTSSDGTSGVAFAVWAPNASSVALVGNFNHWTVGEHPMESRGDSGVWDLFLPDLHPGELYKFAVKSRASGATKLKADPFAFSTELRPRTASIVTDLAAHQWRDSQWLEARARRSQLEGPLAAYEVHLGSWRRNADGSVLSYASLAKQLVPYVKEMGFTHLELLPVMEHPLDESWGYQTSSYYAPTSRYGSPQGLMGLVDDCHREGVGVILDWVPAHFPKDDFGLGEFDGTHLYEHDDPRKGVHPDWGTYIFNYGRNEVKSFLVSNALFWLDKYHVDGLRLDAVASMLYLDYSRKEGEWVPNKYGGRENIEAIELIREVSEAVHDEYPNALLIAEESTAWPGVTRPASQGGLGMDLKWNMGWMHDTLEYFVEDPIYRKHLQNKLTFSLWYAFSEKFILPFSHDEVVHGKLSMLSKMPGDAWQKFANLRLCYAYMYAHPGKKLLFMGDELGQRDEWNFGSALDWTEGSPLKKGLRSFVRDLNRTYAQQRALNQIDFSPEGFEWIDFGDYEKSVVSFLRKSSEGETVIGAFNMTPVPRLGYRVGVPSEGRYEEILNSDALTYGGSGVGNLGGVDSEPIPMHGREHSLNLTLPPLAAVLFRNATN